MTTILKQILTAGTILASSGGALLASNDGSNYIRTTTFLTGSVTPTPGRVNNVYYDGMGREVLTVSGVSNEPQDMIAVRSDYDDRGNLWRKWLPVPGNESLLNKRSYESAAKGLYGSGEMPYTTYGYEETGRNRLVSEAGPGKHWHLKDVTKKFFRNADTLTHEKRNLICTMLRVDDADGRVMVGPFYKTGTLRITDTTDEDGISTLVFENRSGNVVLKRTISADGKMTADTRFVYDIRGDLRYVISPEGSKRMKPPLPPPVHTPSTASAHRPPPNTRPSEVRGSSHKPS